MLYLHICGSAIMYEITQIWENHLDRCHTNQLQQVKHLYLYLIWKIIRTIVKLVTAAHRKLYGIKVLCQELAKCKTHNCPHSAMDAVPQNMPSSVQGPSCRAMGTHPSLSRKWKGLVPSESRSLLSQQRFLLSPCPTQCWTGKGTLTTDTWWNSSSLHVFIYICCRSSVGLLWHHPYLSITLTILSCQPE